MRRAVTFSASLSILLSFACGSAVRVPPSDYGAPGSASAYRIQTIDRRTFSVARYVVSDSTIVVEKMAKSSSSSADAPTVPFEIPLKDVESIDRIAMDRGRASAWVFGVGVVALAVIFFSGGAVNDS